MAADNLGEYNGQIDLASVFVLRGRKKTSMRLVLCPGLRHYLLCPCGEIGCSGSLGIYSCFFIQGAYLTEKRKGGRSIVYPHYLKIPDLHMCLLSPFICNPHISVPTVLWLVNTHRAATLHHPERTVPAQV